MSNYASGNVIKAQVKYSESDKSLLTAKEIIDSKIRNSELFLTDYIQSRLRIQSEVGNKLQTAKIRLSSLKKRLPQLQDRQAVFLLEAEAGRLYWRSVSLICHFGNEWKRFYPHAMDSLNILFNSGYLMLARCCGRAIGLAGLLPEIGIYHGENSRHPLVYDLMEVFRLPVVDVVVVPIFSRHSHNKIEKDSHEFKKVLALLHQRYKKYFYYRGRCEKLERIIALEAVHLRQAIVSHQVWQPYRHIWGHRQLCGK